MFWKQFLTPARSVTAEEGRNLVATTPVEELTILDVRQPREYTRAHLPGAKLIPLPELVDRLDELDPARPVLVY